MDFAERQSYYGAANGLIMELQTKYGWNTAIEILGSVHSIYRKVPGRSTHAILAGNGASGTTWEIGVISIVPSLGKMEQLQFSG